MKKKFNIEVEMEERWIPYFMSFLKHMQYDGNIGHSELLGFYSDGDGDFRPKFTFSIDGETVNPVDITSKDGRIVKVIYDAG